MLPKPGTIICDVARTPASKAFDWHDVIGHHRYYGSTALNGGERIVENRRGPRSRRVKLCGLSAALGRSSVAAVSAH